MLTSIISFIVVLGVLVFFHELGHFLVARFFGVGVEKFSLGFGPRIIGKKSGITDYRISAIPLGGYVKMVGEEPDAEITPEQEAISFTHKHVLKRIAIVGAGPVFNFILAVLIFFTINMVYGIEIVKPYVGQTVAGMPANQAGIQKGDLIVSIEGVPIEVWQDMLREINTSEGKKLSITVNRNGIEKTFAIKPLMKIEKIFGIEVKRYLIGIQNDPTQNYMRKLNPIEALSAGVSYSYTLVKFTVIGIGKIFKGTESPKTIGGPILIAQMAGHAAKGGIRYLVEFIGFVSVILAFFNLLPIPVLDGGHLLFFFIEFIARRPVSIRVREIAQQTGLFLLILLMIFVFYNDITRILFN